MKLLLWLSTDMLGLFTQAPVFNAWHLAYSLVATMLTLLPFLSGHKSRLAWSVGVIRWVSTVMWILSWWLLPHQWGTARWPSLAGRNNNTLMSMESLEKSNREYEEQEAQSRLVQR